MTRVLVKKKESDAAGNKYDLNLEKFTMKLLEKVME